MNKNGFGKSFITFNGMDTLQIKSGNKGVYNRKSSSGRIWQLNLDKAYYKDFADVDFSMSKTLYPGGDHVVLFSTT